MGVTPLEMQVMIPKAVDVAKQQSSEAHKANAAQQNINAKEIEKKSEDTKRVHDRNTAEKIYVDEQEKDKKEKENEKRKSNNDNDEDVDSEEKSENKYSGGFSGGHFDASV